MDFPASYVSFLEGIGFLDVPLSSLRIVEQHAWDVWKDPASKKARVQPIHWKLSSLRLKDIKRPVVTQGSLTYLFFGGIIVREFPLNSALFG